MPGNTKRLRYIMKKLWVKSVVRSVLVVMLCMMPTACGMIPTTGNGPETRIVTDSSCMAFDELGYACEPINDENDNLIGCSGEEDDTVQTVIGIREHNASYQSLECP